MALIGMKKKVKRKKNWSFLGTVNIKKRKRKKEEKGIILLFSYPS